MSRKLTLNPSGTNGCTPVPDPWKPPNGANVEIFNNSGHSQTLSYITNGCLIKTGPGGGPVTSIDLENKKSWHGKAGRSKGTYKYNDGVGSPKLDMRNGTIDPS